MDSVRFGRALGLGARQAVKTIATAVDAATAENPSGKAAPAAGRAAPQVLPSVSRTAARPVRQAAANASAAARASTAAGQARELRQGVKRGSKRFGSAVWSPFVRLSGVLWLEITGFFFGILALFAAVGVWKTRAEVYPGAARHQDLIGALAMAVVFGYFCGSSFVRARRRERQR